MHVYQEMLTFHGRLITSPFILSQLSVCPIIPKFCLCVYRFYELGRLTSDSFQFCRGRYVCLYVFKILFSFQGRYICLIICKILFFLEEDMYVWTFVKYCFLLSTFWISNTKSRKLKWSEPHWCTKRSCTQFSLYQCIDEPTHYTEHSSSVIDLLFVSNKDHLIHSGVADAFLNQDLRYHCPIYGIFKFSKLKVSSFTRRIWYYDRCDKVNAVDWNSLQDNNIDTYASNIHSTVMSLATEYIPNKHVRVRLVEPLGLIRKLKDTSGNEKELIRELKEQT